MSLDQFNIFLSVGTVIGQFVIVCAILMLMFGRKIQLKAFKYIIEHAIVFAFIVALVSTLSSLYYSQIAHFVPCNLCWYQRILMYPLVLMLGFALWRKSVRILEYSLLLSGIGTIISLYHNYIYYTAKVTNFCGLVSCSERYIVGFGYISIPLMALTGFLLIDLLLLNKKMLHR